MTDRRTFLAGSMAALARPLAAWAQQARQIPTVGILFHSSPVADMTGAEPRHPYLRGFMQGLRELGYVEGNGIRIERRTAEGHPERLPALAAELVGLKVAVIVTTTLATIEAARRATSTIPIVMASGPPDPAQSGLVASLARPSGNLTGLSLSTGYAIAGKRLDLLKEAAPRISRVGVLSSQTDPQWPALWEPARAAATALGLTLLFAKIDEPDDFPRAFAAITGARADALLVSETAETFVRQHLIIDFAAKHRMPAVYAYTDSVKAGGLMGYGTDYVDLFRRAATYVARILKGARPGELPIEQPTKFLLAVNMRTARALGLTIPPSLLLRAEQVVD